MWFTSDGVLALSAPDDSARPRFKLLRYLSGINRFQNNIETSEVRWNIAERYSKVTVLGQESDFVDQASQPGATRTDSEMQQLGLTRPLVIIDHEVTSVKSADKRARWEIERRRAEGLTLTYSVEGHRQDGALWCTNAIVQVYDEHDGVDGEYLITKARYSRSPEEGTRTSLTLRRKGALLGLPDAVNPEKELF